MAAEVRQATSVALPPPVPRITWSREQQGFIVMATDRGSTPVSSRLTPRQPRGSAWDELLSIEIDGENGEQIVVDQFIHLRENLMNHMMEAQQIHKSASDDVPSPLLSLPAFVSHWYQRLDRMTTVADEQTVGRLCPVFHDLAATAMQVGDVVLARRALGRCIQLSRRKPIHSEMEREAKHLLLQCVQYQHAHQRCELNLQRQHVPPFVLTTMLEKLQALQTLAPYAVDVMELTVHALQSLNRSKDVVASLSAFVFTPTSAPLTLAYATALEFEGFYQQSITVATKFSLDPLQYPTVVTTAVVTHATRLTTLLAHKAKGDDALQQSCFDTAERAFENALGIVNSQSKRLRAALLLGRANSWIGLERLQSAQRDLQESLELDPSNQITRLRLRTVDLALETQRMHRRFH